MRFGVNVATGAAPPVALVLLRCDGALPSNGPLWFLKAAEVLVTSGSGTVCSLHHRSFCLAFASLTNTHGAWHAGHP
jgi:hypothetical protein